MFYTLKGNNSATYILNTKDYYSIQHSLRFYKSRSAKTIALKQSLQCYLFLRGLFFSWKLKSAQEINNYLKKSLNTNINFDVDEGCSVFISSTRDKVIINHHDKYFQKFAFGESHLKVKNEVKIYSLFHNKIEYFQVSDFFDYEYQANIFCSFKLSNNNVRAKKNKPLNIVLPLIEFFKLTQGKTITVNEYLSALLIKLNIESGGQFELAKNELNRLKKKYTQINMPLGLVHRDFKPWNIINFTKPLIFDFEETVMDGPPMEDLFNFLIDPIILYKSTKEVSNYIFKKHNVKLYKFYLSKLNLEVDFKLFLKMYLFNKILFLEAHNKHNTSNKYKELLYHIIRG